jgi:hypothetical protein
LTGGVGDGDCRHGVAQGHGGRRFAAHLKANKKRAPRETRGAQGKSARGVPLETRKQDPPTHA